MKPDAKLNVKRAKEDPKDRKPEYAIACSLGNWFVDSRSESRVVAVCTRELDAQMIAAALNNQRANPPRA